MRLEEVVLGWFKLFQFEVGCGWVKWVKVCHMGSGQVANKDGYRELAIPIPTI